MRMFKRRGRSIQHWNTPSSCTTTSYFVRPFQRDETFRRWNQFKGLFPILPSIKLILFLFYLLYYILNLCSPLFASSFTIPFPSGRPRCPPMRIKYTRGQRRCNWDPIGNEQMSLTQSWSVLVHCFPLESFWSSVISPFLWFRDLCLVIDVLFGLRYFEPGEIDEQF